MPVHRALATFLLILASSLAARGLHADELKDIAQQIKLGQQGSALDRTNAYLKSHPGDAQAMLLKGVALAELNRRDEAIKAFLELSEKHPNLPEPHNNLAVLYAEQGQYEKAKKALEAALRTHPSYATAHNNLAGVYAHMASEAYDKALQLDNKPRLPATRLALIRDMSGTEKPTVLAAKSPEIKLAQKEPDKPAELPPLPIRPAEPVKSADAGRPAELPAKSADIKPAEIKPVEIKAPEPEPQPELEKKSNAGKAGNEKDVTMAVQSWAQAWSSKNVEKYLASYADNFKTPDGQSRKEWEQNRRERIAKPAAIKVDISNLRVKLDDGKARASFKQTYRAGSTVMRTPKTLVFRNESGKWLIEQEQTDR
jgi:hypothetical protein